MVHKFVSIKISPRDKPNNLGLTFPHMDAAMGAANPPLIIKAKIQSHLNCLMSKSQMNVKVSAKVTKNAVVSIEPITFRGELLFDKIKMGVVSGPQPPPKRASEKAAKKAKTQSLCLEKALSLV
jgi:hypothetical protein